MHLVNSATVIVKMGLGTFQTDRSKCCPCGRSETGALIPHSREFCQAIRA